MGLQAGQFGTSEIATQGSFQTNMVCWSLAQRGPAFVSSFFFGMAISTWEENAFNKYKDEYPWLTLERDGDSTFLGCRICMQSESKKRRGFATGRYEVRKYFNERNLQQHMDAPIHRNSSTSHSAPPPESEPDKAPASPELDVLSTPQKSKETSEPSTPSTGGSAKKKTVARNAFQNLMRAVYTVLHQCLPGSIFQLLTSFALSCGGNLPHQQSSSVFEECRELICNNVQARLSEAIRHSPYFAVSIDEKETMVIIVVTFLNSACEKVSAPLSYKNLSGMEAADLFAAVQNSLENVSLQKENLVAFCADGASVMGTRKAMSDPRDGNNVVRRLEAYCGHPLLVQHCSPHRLQLAIESAFHTDDYFKEIEKRMRTLFTHLRNHKSASIDLLFWSELSGEDVLGTVSTSAARWLSWLRPLEKIQRSYISLLAHLMYEFTHHANREQKKTIQWLFKFMCTWEYRITIAGIIDVLRICFKIKNLLETARSLTSVGKLARQLDEELKQYCRKHSVLADAMSGERDLPHSGTEAETICALWRQQKDQHLRLTYALVGGHVIDEKIRLEGMASPEHMKTIFRRVKAFSEVCQENVLKRFECKSVWEHAYVFETDYQLQNDTFQVAMFEMATCLNLPSEQLISQMRTLFAIRNNILRADDHKNKEPEQLWLKVLKEAREQDLPVADRLVSSFLLCPSQAAECERCFAQATRLFNELGAQTSPQVIHGYLLVSKYAPDPTECGNIITECTDEFLLKERRDNLPSGKGVYRCGRRMVERKRAVRKDVGQKRPVYKSRKRHQGLQSLPNARKIARGSGSAEMVDGQGDTSHAIFQQMSPRRKNARKAEETAQE